VRASHAQGGGGFGSLVSPAWALAQGDGESAGDFIVDAAPLGALVAA